MTNAFAPRPGFVAKTESVLIRNAGVLVTLVVAANAVMLVFAGTIFCMMTYPQFMRYVLDFVHSTSIVNFFVSAYKAPAAAFFCAAAPFFVVALRGHFRFSLLEMTVYLAGVGALMGLALGDTSNTLDRVLALIGAPAVAAATIAIVARRFNSQSVTVWMLVGAGLAFTFAPKHPAFPVALCGLGMCISMLGHMIRPGVARAMPRAGV